MGVGEGVLGVSMERKDKELGLEILSGGVWGVHL